tara:strand:- start:84 stop:461 length:378 start_codon:yes stop_codon:yes gene_type:complete
VQILKKTLQVLLFAIFAFGGMYRLSQPMDALLEDMLWVSYFHPFVVRAIAIAEVIGGVGLAIPFFWKDSRMKIDFYGGILLIGLMTGAAITHVVIGDYDQIIINVFLIAVLVFVTIPRGLKKRPE